MNKYWIVLASLVLGATTLLASAALTPTSVSAHCQVPCGIYDDEGRVDQLREDATTIAKAINMMSELAAKQDVQSLNQLARWVATKEAHASHIITVVSEYFLTQKVKPVAANAEGYHDYLGHLADHHAVMSAAMKTKQQANEDSVKALRGAIERLAKHYKSK